MNQKLITRILALLLVLAMVLGMIPLVFADEGSLGSATPDGILSNESLLAQLTADTPEPAAANKRLSEAKMVWSGGEEDIYRFSYDDRGRLESVTTEIYGGTKANTVYTYDSDNRFIRADQEWSGNTDMVDEYVYDEFGFLVSEYHRGEGGGGRTTYENDAMGRPIRSRETFGVGTTVTEYRYSSDDRQVDVTETTTWDWSETTQDRYTLYHTLDDRGRTIKTRRTSADSSFTMEYDYNSGPLVAISYDGALPSYFYIADVMGHPLWRLSVSSPSCVERDADGYISRIVTGYYTWVLVYEKAEANYTNNELDFDVDVWKFINYGDSSSTGSALLENHKAMVLSGLSNSDLAMMKTLLSEGHPKGHCFGLSVTTILQKMDNVDMSLFTGTKNLRDANRTVNVESILCYYQNTWYLKAYQEALQDFIRKSAVDQLKILSDMANSVKFGGIPVLLDFRWGTGENISAHAVVAYAFESGKFHSHSTGSNRTYDSRILIYDSNAVNFFGTSIWDPDYCLLFNSGTDQWEIPAYAAAGCYHWDDENGTGVLQCCTNSIAALNPNQLSNQNSNYVPTLTLTSPIVVRLEQTSTGHSWTIDGTTGTVQGDTELTYSYSTGSFADGTPPDISIILPDEMDTYRITTVSGIPEDLALNILYDDKFVAVSGASASGAELSHDGTLMLSGSQGEFQIVVADDTIPDGAFNTYFLTGSAEGNVNVSMDKTGLTVTGDDLDQVAIEASEGDKEDTVTIEDAGQQIVISRDDDNLVVEKEDGHGYQYGDVNHDGRINVTDAVMVMKHRANALTEDDFFCPRCANVDTNPKINVSDAVLIMKKRANKDMIFPIEQQ